MLSVKASCFYFQPACLIHYTAPGVVAPRYLLYLLFGQFLQNTFYSVCVTTSYVSSLDIPILPHGTFGKKSQSG